MANLDQPCGAVPYGELRRAQKYTAGSTCYPGDFVALAADGMVDPAAAGAAMLGVALSYASGVGVEVLVADDPDQMFQVQASATEVDAQTDIGQEYDVLATAGSATYKISRHELDSASAADPAGLRLLAIDERPDNALGANVDCVVMINEHQLKVTAAV